MSDTPWTDKNKVWYDDIQCVNADDVRDIERSHNRLLDALKNMESAFISMTLWTGEPPQTVKAAHEAIKQAIC